MCDHCGEEIITSENRYEEKLPNYPFNAILSFMNILLVAPYPDLVEQARQVIDSFHYPVHIVQGNLYRGLRAAQKELESGNVQIVISRGGTASLLRQNLSLPVFDIEVSGYDLLRAINPHAKQDKNIAVIGYENVITGAKSIAEILGINLGYFLITKKIQTAAVVEEAKAWGADVIVGDTISVNTAGELGLQSELVRSGPEAIQSAIESSLRLLDRMNIEIVRNKRLSLMMEQSDYGIMYIATDGLIQLVNSKAEHILGREKHHLIGYQMSKENTPRELLNVVSADKTNQLMQLDGKDYMVELKKIRSDENHTATLIFIQSSARIKDLEGLLRKEMVSRGLIATYHFDDITAKNRDFLQIVAKARLFSQKNATILLLGETGSGKELFAQSIHNTSQRKSGPFVAVNCAALPDTLLESELFGYAEGAFTGAMKGGKQGLFEMAHKGTIFLDEVNDMSPSVQARMLRVLQEKQVMRVGDNRVFDVDVRVIAACNKDLFTETENGQFRKDLYYRLKVLDIKIPPLRERPEDILPLFESFLRHFNGKYDFAAKQIPSELESAILTYQWPGNVRQLKNFAEKVSILLSLDQDVFDTVEDLIEDLSSQSPQGIKVREVSSKPFNTDTIRQAGMEIIRACWEKNDRNISRTARQLGLDRATVRKNLGE